MKHIPKYLLPRIAPVPGSGGETAPPAPEVGFVPFKKTERGRGRGRGRGGRGRGGFGGRGGKKKSDPLKKFGR